MKIFYLLLPLCTALLLGFGDNQANANDIQPNAKWRLVWEDNFKTPKLNDTQWIKIKRCGNNSAWCKHMTTDPKVFEFQTGNLLLKGMLNPKTIPTDSRKYWTGGISSLGKFHFTYGKVEVRLKLENAKGAWPAIWLLPRFNNYGAYPRNGEIDMMEHLNHDRFIYQTIHSYYTLELKQKANPLSFNTAHVDVSKFNTYGLEWYPHKLVFIVNGKETFSYPRRRDLTADKLQWPFDKPFYLLIDQQLGGGWVGNVNSPELPVNMIVDYARVYEQTSSYNHIKSLDGKPNGLCITAGKNDQSVMTNTCEAGLTEQIWVLENGLLRNGNGLCLAVEGRYQDVPGQKVIIWECNNGREQRWHLSHNKMLKNDSGLCLEIPGRQGTAGANVIINTCNKNKNQQWIRKNM